VQKINQQKLQEIGTNNNANIEQILSLKPGLITTYGVGDPKLDIYPQLTAAKIPTVLISEYMESTPLGRAEWLKFMAVFFNQEKVANQRFSEIEKKYTAIVELTKNVPDKPKVLSGSERKGTWYIPGGDSYVAKFINDAGGDYLWADDRNTGSLNLSTEQVLPRAYQGQIWLNSNQDSDVFSNPIYQKFPAIVNGNVFNPTKKVNDRGGNDFWESGTANPDLVLADLVKIFHPELLPNHQFIYYQRDR
jgi:iron complex transport system substrate-binding protein